MNACVVCDKEFKNEKKYEVKCCSKSCSALFRNKQAYHLHLWMKKNVLMEYLQKLADNFHTSAMIRDLLRRDYGLSEECSLKQVSTYLNRYLNYRSHKECQSQPQWFKLQYKYPKGWTTEQIHEDISNKAKIGQAKTIKIRIQKGNTGNTKFKREDSPLCIEFYTSRGFGEEFAKEQINDICLAGALSVCKGRKVFSTEEKIKKILHDKNLEFQTQFEIRLLNEEKTFNKRSYIYDFYVPERHLLIECNGLYWHASPEIYKSGDIIKLPRHGEVLVDKIWKIDAHKKYVAEKRGYKFLTIWEGKEDERLF